MTRLEGLGRDLEVQRARVRARLKNILAPEALTAELHDIGFVAREKVLDTVTGQEVEVVGSGVEQVETGS